MGVVPCGQDCSDTSVDAQAQTALNRVVFTMQKVEDRWLVDDVVPSEGARRSPARNGGGA